MSGKIVAGDDIHCCHRYNKVMQGIFLKLLRLASRSIPIQKGKQAGSHKKKLPQILLYAVQERNGVSYQNTHYS